jgi:hypothetical protein
MRHLPGFVAAAVATCTLPFVATSFAAPTKAWTAAKASLPADTAVVVGIDVSAIAKSATFTKLFPVLLAKSDDAKQALDLVKSACKIDPLVALKSVAVGLNSTQDDGAVYLNVIDLDAAKLTSCLKEVAKAKGAGDKVEALTVTTTAGITEMASGDKHLFFGWIGTDVLVMVPKHLEDKAALKNYMGGGFAKGTLTKMLGKVKTESAIFVASSVGKSLDATHTLKQGYGWVTLAAPNLSIEFHGDFGDAAAAKGLATDASTQIDEMRKNPPLPAVADMLKNVSVVSVSTEVVAKATVIEKDFADLVSMALATL